MAAGRRAERLTPEQLERATFTTTFRGYDIDQVRALLADAAEALREAGDREAVLRTDVEALRRRNDRDEPLDEAELTAVLGEETARVLTAAREAAAEIRSKAEEAAARLVREASEEATATRAKAGEEAAAMRAEAASVLELRRTEATAAADAIRAEASEAAAAAVAAGEAQAEALRGEADQIRISAVADAERIRAEATAAGEGELEAARAQGRAMVLEAQAVRERVLKDLARKRKTARAQLEQLRAGRERLLDAYQLVQRTVAEATGELQGSLVEAKLAADAAVRRVEEEAEPSIDELEAEVEAARLAGLPIVDTGAAVVEAGSTLSGEVPVVAPSPEPPPAPAPAPPSGAAPPPPIAPESPPPASAAVQPPASPPPGPVDELPPLPEEIPPPPATPEPFQPPRKGRRRRGTPDLPPVVLQPMVPRDPVEGMRVITGEVPVVRIDEPTAPPGPAPEPAAPAAPIEAATPADAGRAEVEIIEVIELDDGEVRAAAVVVDFTVAPEEVETGAEPEVSAVDADGGSGPETVDDLFARMRAARAEQVAQANQVLEATAPSEAAAEEAPGEPAATEPDAPLPEVAAEPDAAVLPDDETLLERRDASIDDIEAALVRKLKRVLADEQNEALDGLRRSRKPGLDALYPDGADGQQARWRAAAAADLQAAASAGAAFNGSSDVTIDTGELATNLAADLVGPLRDRVETALRDASGDEDAAADGVRAAYREWKSRRVADVARDAVIAAFGFGLFSAAPAGTPHRWVVDDPAGPCPDCDDNALAGLVVKGTAFPTGHLHPPAHPGCRCLLSPS